MNLAPGGRCPVNRSEILNNISTVGAVADVRSSIRRAFPIQPRLDPIQEFVASDRTHVLVLAARRVARRTALFASLGANSLMKQVPEAHACLVELRLRVAD
jgi:hypothetical protein